PILHFGRPQKKTSPGGRAPGAEDVRDGTLNALRWQSGISVKLLTFTAAALILSFLTMTMRSPSRRRSPASPLQNIGYITASSLLTKRKCQNPLETFSLYVKYLINSIPRLSGSS